MGVRILFQLTFLLAKWFPFVCFEKNICIRFIFIHMYIIIKYRSASIKGKFHQLLWELQPSFNFFFQQNAGFKTKSFEKLLVSGLYLLDSCMTSFLVVGYRQNLLRIT